MEPLKEPLKELFSNDQDGYLHAKKNEEALAEWLPIVCGALRVLGFGFWS